MAARFPVLWPQETFRSAINTQLAADLGDPTVAWRTRPRVVGLTFAHQVLGWSEPGIESVDRWTYEGVERARVYLFERGDGSGADRPAEHHLWLERSVRPGESGVWFARTVESLRVHTELSAPGKTLPAGAQLWTFVSGLPSGTRAVAGSFFRGPCGLVVDASRIRYWHRDTRFQVAPHGDGKGDCAPERYSDREPLFELSDGAVVVARASWLRPGDIHDLFSSTENPRGPVLDLNAYAVEFLPSRQAELLGGVPSWWSINPRRLPVCADHQLRLVHPEAGEGYPNGGFGLGVQIRLGQGGACRVRETFSLDVTTAREPARVRPNPSILRIRGELPRDYVVAAWVLYNWCASAPPVFTVEGAGQRTTFSAFRDVLCDRHRSPATARAYPAPGLG